MPQLVEIERIVEKIVGKLVREKGRKMKVSELCMREGRVVYADLGYVSSLWFHAHFTFFIVNHFMSFFDNDMLRLDCRDSGGSHY